MIKTFLEYMKSLELPYRDNDCLERIRVQKFKDIILHSKNNVKFYAEKYAGLDVNSINSIEDIRKFPVVKPGELKQEELKNITSQNYDLSKCIPIHTSGTSGVAFKFYVNREEYLLRQLKHLRFLRQHGWKPWWKAVTIWRDVEKQDYTIFQRLVNKRRFFVSVNLSPREQVREILKIRPQILAALTPTLEVLADFMIENRIFPKGIEFVLTGGDLLRKDLPTKFRKAFGHPGIDLYSSSESGIIGGECPECHLNYLDEGGHIIEIVDDNNDPIQADGTGRVLITCLDQHTTPIIRYDIGDAIKLAPKETDCKVRYTHYVSVEGRRGDMLTLKDGRIIHLHHVDPLWMKMGSLKQLQFYQKRSGHLLIRYVPKYGIDKKKVKNDILEQVNLKDYTDLSFEECDVIPLESSGKFKIIKRETENVEKNVCKTFSNAIDYIRVK